MATEIVELSVFISCPSNLSELREVAEAAIEEVSSVLRTTKSIALRSVSWAKDIVPGVAGDGQEVINNQTIGKYDVYLGIIGSRFGSATPRAGSGTEEEFDLALSQFHRDPSSIRILFYLQAFVINPFEISPSELQKVMDFRSKLQHQGVLYKELTSLDDALASIKNHLLQLVTADWNTKNKKWIITTTNSPVDIQSKALKKEEFITKTIESLATSGAEGPSAELGLMELQVIGIEELGLAAASIQEMGNNLTQLTEKTTSKFENFDGSLGIAHAMEVINDYAKDISDFLSKSRGDLANTRFHLSKGADCLENFYEQMRMNKLTPAESAEDLSKAIEGIEPSLRQFRDSATTLKQTVDGIPPMTGRLKTAKVGLTSFFDQVALEMTLSIERLSLLRTRLLSHQNLQGLINKQSLPPAIPC